MLPWRKVHSVIIGSDKLSRVSDSAFRLYVYLLVAQDDDGTYPWTRISRKALTVGTTWTDDQADAFAQELVTGGLLHVTDGQLHVTDARLHVVNGPRFNGHDKSQRRISFKYESDLNLNTVQPVVSYMQPVVSARGEEIRKEAAPAPAREAAAANPLVAALVQNYETHIGMLAPVIGETLTDFAKRNPAFPLDWVPQAFVEAVKANARKLSYVMAVLNKSAERKTPPGQAKPQSNGLVSPNGKVLHDLDLGREKCPCANCEARRATA